MLGDFHLLDLFTQRSTISVRISSQTSGVANGRGSIAKPGVVHSLPCTVFAGNTDLYRHGLVKYSDSRGDGRYSLFVRFVIFAV